MASTMPQGARVAGEEVLAHEGAGLGLVGLEVTVGGRVQQIDEGPVVVGVESRSHSRPQTTLMTFQPAPRK